MVISRIFHTLRASACLTWLVTHSHAQELGAFKPVQWVSRNTVLVNEKNSSRSAMVTYGGGVHALSRPGGRLDTAALQESLQQGVPGDLFQHEGHLYGQSFRTGGPKNELMVSALHMKEGERWVKVGEWSHPRNRGRVLIYPLDNGQFLAWGKESLDPDYPDARKTPFALLRVNDKGEFQCRSFQETGFPKWPEWTEAAWRLPSSLVAHTDDHIVLVLQRYGLYWVFAKENGRMLHHGRLYGATTDEAIHRDLVLPLVFHVQPTPDGSLLWSTRTEAAATEAASGMEDLKRLEAQIGMANQETEKGWINAWRQKWIELDNRFPDIAWWRFEPRSGTFQRLNPAPPGARETRVGLKDAEAFHWVPTPDGRIRSTSLAFEGLGRTEEPKRTKPEPAGIRKP